jgi:hyperosmotically inducible periplasmic protein
MNKHFLLALCVVTGTLLVTAAPLRASETDDRIESSFKQSYVFKTYLKDDAISIESKDGIVTLSGSVTEGSHKSLAQETAAALPGVKRVDNRLELKGDHPDEHSDGWLDVKVKTTLLFHRNVNAHGTDVEVKDGIVTLKGEAASQAQKELTTEYAKEVEGIKDVKNEMTVAKTAERPGESLSEQIDDASVTAQVKMSLFFHSSTSALRTKVTTNLGVVTVGGQANNSAEKQLVTKLVEDIHGVKKVVNKMTIAGGAANK